MVELYFDKSGDPVVKNLIKGLKTNIAAHDPEHVETPEGIYGNDPFSRGNVAVSDLKVIERPE